MVIVHRGSGRDQLCGVMAALTSCAVKQFPYRVGQWTGTGTDYCEFKTVEINVYMFVFNYIGLCGLFSNAQGHVYGRTIS